MAIKIEIIQGNIIEAETESIVNAANNHLWMGSGVAGAIKEAGGVEIEKEAVGLGPIEAGDAVATGAGKLKHKYIIHAAGMGQDLKTNGELIYSSTQSSLKVADKLNIKSIAFPAIGTGVGCISPEECASAMLNAVWDIAGNLNSVEIVQFILYDEYSLEVFINEYKSLSN